MSKGPVEEFTVAGGDVSGDVLPDGVDAHRGHPRNRRPWRGALPWVSAAVVLVLLGVLAAPVRAPEVSAWGQVADATSHPEQAWTFQPDEGGLRSALLADGVLVAVTTHGLLGLDPADGSQRWSRTLDWPRCTSDGVSLVCAERGSRVLDLDPDSGVTLTERELPGVQLAARDSDSLYAIVEGERLQLQRLTDGAPVWSTTLATPAPATAHGENMAVIAGHVLTDWAAVAGQHQQTGSAVLDARSGEPVGSADDPVTARRVAPGVWTSSTFLAGSRYLRGQDEPQPIAPAARSVGYDDDWTGTDRLRSGEDGRVAIHDTVTDSWRWQGGGPQIPLARLDGALIGLDFEPSPHLQARDVATGELLWQRENTLAQCPCLADEHTLVLTANTVSTGEHGFAVELPQLTALAARTGETLWQLEPLDSTPDVLTDGERLITTTGTGITGWDLG